MSQLNGFSPVCTRRCRLRLTATLKLLPHISQLKAFSPV
uniref:Uncharacterized protein n=1 Tax=Anguilla anguilla TaxID=7936 RepID=A0A0E9QK18_ANGAN